MVTSGSRASPRGPSSGAGFAASASASTSRREDVRDAVGVDGDQADRLLALHRADDLGDAGAVEAVAAGAGDGHRDEVAVLAPWPRRPASRISSFCLRSTGSMRAPSRRHADDAEHASAASARGA